MPPDGLYMGNPGNFFNDILFQASYIRLSSNPMLLTIPDSTDADVIFCLPMRRYIPSAITAWTSLAGALAISMMRKRSN